MAVDEEEYVSRGAPNFLKLAAVIISSLVLTIFGGIAAVLGGGADAFAQLFTRPMAWIEGTTGEVLGAFAESLNVAWEGVGVLFPLAGPLDFAIGVLLMAAFMFFVEWVWRTVWEVI